jgi:hypothetical protein
MDVVRITNQDGAATPGSSRRLTGSPVRVRFSPGCVADDAAEVGTFVRAEEGERGTG